MKFLFFFILGTLVSSVQAQELTFLSKTKSDHFHKAISELNALLPAKFKEALPQTIHIEFKSLNGKEISAVSCEPGVKFGMLNKITQKITLDPVMLKELERGDRDVVCPNKLNPHVSTRRLFMATVIHELAHLYDKSRDTSSDPIFLNLSGWMKKGKILRRKVNLNQNQERTPDAYELKNPSETFAVNVEHFLLDENYSCRRPTYHQYFSKKFGSLRSSDCRVNTKIILTDGGTSGLELSSIQKDLDIDRLYEIHYLFAGKGEQLMSRFGHAMFRLVICAPDRPVGPACMADITHHVVISYRANVTDSKVSYVDGLRGEYPSQLFLLSLRSVIDEYTKGEYREVSSLPLKLSYKEKALFLQKTLENYWSYSGKYYFFSNNCATESMNLLKVALGETYDTEEKVIVTPNGMLNYLKKKGIANDSVFKDLTVAEKKGYYFPSAIDKITSSFEYLKIPEKSMETFVKKYDADRRRSIYLKIIDSSDNKLKASANALRIEDTIYMNQMKVMLKKIADIHNDPRASAQLKDPRLMELVEEMVKLKDATSAQIIASTSYGIPLEHEYMAPREDDLSDVKERINENSQEILKILKVHFASDVEEIEKIAKNVQELKLRLVQK